MKKLISLFLLTTMCMLASWKPYTEVKNIVTGKYSWGISVLAFGGAEGSDYRTTVTTVRSGAGVEANPLLTTNGVLNENRLLGFKTLTFIEPVAVESYLYYKMNPDQRKKYGKWMTLGNWVAACVVGGVAYHNRQIYEHRIR